MGDARVSDLQNGHGKAQRATLLGLGASVLLAGGKLLAGIFGHSTALIADAIESFADTASSMIVLHAQRVAERPPDEDHPYGHGKAEAVSAVVVCVLLVVAAVLIVIEATGQMFTPHKPPAVWTLAVLVGVIVIKEGLFRVVAKVAMQTRSSAGEADAWHHRADAITSLAALVGVTIAIWGPGWFGSPRLVIADEVAALCASGVIVFTAFRLLHGPLHELLDAAPPEFIERVRAAAQTVEGVRHVEKVFARKGGAQYHVDMHVHVDPKLTIGEAHVISGKVRSHLRATMADVRDVLVHVEPEIERTEV